MFIKCIASCDGDYRIPTFYASSSFLWDDFILTFRIIKQLFLSYKEQQMVSDGLTRGFEVCLRLTKDES